MRTLSVVDARMRSMAENTGYALPQVLFGGRPEDDRYDLVRARSKVS